jgi:hypothetical protein
MLLEAADLPVPTVPPDTREASPFLEARRLIAILASAIPVVIAVLVVAAVIPAWRAQQRTDTDRLVACLDLLRDQRNVTTGRSVELRVEYREVEIYVSGKFGDRLRALNLSGVPSQLRPTATHVIAFYPHVSAAEYEQARQLVEPAFDAYLSRRRNLVRDADRLGMPATLGVVSMIVLGAIAIGSVILSVAKPGGILYDLIGLQVLDAQGRPVTRARSAARALLTWSPLAVVVFAPAAWAAAPSTAVTLYFWSPALLLAAGALATLRRPWRGLVDGLVNTWVV